MDSKKGNRFMELEGLRGIAAVIVVLFHLSLMLYPNIAQTNMHGSPLFVFLYGTFSVMIFFVLSGFVLTIGFFQTGRTEIIKKLAAKRYLRLMLPALASVLFAYILLKLGLNANKQATLAITNSSWLALTWTQVPHVAAALYDGMITAFIQPGGTPYNGVLWTMYYEFLGSFVVFVTVLVFGTSRYRWTAYLLLAVLTFHSWFLPLILGMALADAFSQGYLKKIIQQPALPLVTFIAGLFFGAYPLASKDTIYAYITIQSYTPDQNMNLYLTLGALLVVTSVLCSRILARFFGHPLVSLLGKYTYSLYLTHLLVVYTLGTFLFVTFQHIGYNKAAALTVLCLVPVFTLVSWLFHKYVDEPAIKFSGYFSDLAFGVKQLDMSTTYEGLKSQGYALLARIRQPRVLNLEYNVEESEAEIESE